MVSNEVSFPVVLEWHGCYFYSMKASAADGFDDEWMWRK
jgi:hypothetical protein